MRRHTKSYALVLCSIRGMVLRQSRRPAAPAISLDVSGSADWSWPYSPITARAKPRSDWPWPVSPIRRCVPPESDWLIGFMVECSCLWPACQTNTSTRLFARHRRGSRHEFHFISFHFGHNLCLYVHSRACQAKSSFCMVISTRTALSLAAWSRSFSSLCFAYICIHCLSVSSTSSTSSIPSSLA